MSDTFMGHPKGLLYCALTEVWERFAYYGMISMLILYLTKSYLISDGDGNRIVGAVGAMLYMSPVLGGAVADRWLGARKSIIAGTVLMAVGFLTMSLPNGIIAAIGLDGGPGGLPSIDFLYLSIAIIVVGNGCVKSNLNKLVGGLYEENDSRRESGFTYMFWAVNFGVILGPLVCSWLGNLYGTRIGISVAGIGMLIGLITFLLGQRHYGPHAEPPAPQQINKRVAPFLSRELAIYLGVALSSVAAWWLFQEIDLISDLLIWFGLGIALFFVYFAIRHCDRKDRDRMMVIGIVLVFTSIFAAVNFQFYGSLLLFGDRYVDRVVMGFEIPASMFFSLSSSLAVTLTPIVAYLLTRVERRGKSPNVMVKISFGILLTGIVFFVPSLAVSVVGSETLLSLWWMMLIFMFLVLGEIFFIPMTLSLIAQIGPKKITAVLFGGFNFALAVGSVIAGELAARYTTSDVGPNGEPVGFEEGLLTYVSAYSLIAAAGVAASVSLLALSPFLHRRMHSD